MKKNDLFEIEITDMGAGGEGIGHYEGMTFFIKDAIIGDVILARATKLKSSYGYARVEEIRTPSASRVTPSCPLHRRCGGCQIQAMAYPRQLEYKQNKVRENLIRIGGFPEELLDAVMEPSVGMEPTTVDNPREPQRMMKGIDVTRLGNLQTMAADVLAEQTQAAAENLTSKGQSRTENEADTAPYRYRNKAQFPVGMDAHGNIVMGFYAAHSHDIIPVDDCLLGVEVNQPILAIIKDWMKRYAIAPYDERTGKGIVRHVLIRYGFQSGQIMVCLIVNAGKLPHAQSLIDALVRMEGMTSISYNINQENTNVILGKKTKCIWGQAYIEDSIRLWECESCREVQEIQHIQGGQVTQGVQEVQYTQEIQNTQEMRDMQHPVTHEYVTESGFDANGFRLTNKKITYHVSPQSFYQVNPIQTEKLYSMALSYAGLTGKEYVWDLYCGIGTISLFLAQQAKQVYGVEIVEQAIEDARENAQRNGISNAEFFVGKAEEVLPEFYRGPMSHPDVIVVDPPRKGCDAKCLGTMLQMQPQRIVYVSCDSATLARDLKILCEGGYELKKARIFDQFPHTVHVETCALLTKSSEA